MGTHICEKSPGPAITGLFPLPLKKGTAADNTGLQGQTVCSEQTPAPRLPKLSSTSEFSFFIFKNRDKEGACLGEL